MEAHSPIAPQSYKEVMQSPNRDEWLAAVAKEQKGFLDDLALSNLISALVTLAFLIFESISIETPMRCINVCSMLSQVWSSFANPLHVIFTPFVPSICISYLN